MTDPIQDYLDAREGRFEAVVLEQADAERDKASGETWYYTTARENFTSSTLSSEPATLRVLRAAAALMPWFTDTHVEEDGSCFECEDEWPCVFAELSIALAALAEEGRHA